MEHIERDCISMQLSVAHSSAVLSALSLPSLLVAHLRAKKKANSVNNNIPSSPGIIGSTATYMPNMWRNGVKSCTLIFSDELVCGKRVDGRLLANVTGDRESAFCFFFLFILQQHFLKQCHLRWSWKKTINSALTRRLFSCAQSWFLFGRNIFHLHPRHHICFGNRSGAVPCHLNYEINWWCDLFSFSKAEGVIERTKEEEKHRRDSKICCVKLYAKRRQSSRQHRLVHSRESF